MSVAELERARSGRSSSGFRRAAGRVLGPAFLSVAVASLVAVAGAGGYLARSSEADRLDRQLTALTAEVGESNDLVTTATDRVLELSAQNQQLTADLDAATDLNGELATRLANVEAAVQGATDLGTGIEALVAERDQLRESLAAISDGFTEQTERLGQLQPIESFGTADNPLLFDESTEAWITQPVCTGSMEPTIGCEDLLVVYKPAPTDLNVDDIIIFQRPGPNCEGVVAGTLLLHRITRVVSTAADGLMFETKGDANPLVDPCRAPVATVTGKVLAVIQNSRLSN